MEALVMFIHIMTCILLIVVVLLQSGKSADLAGAFGGVGSQSTFGPRGAATFLSKMTTTLAILFMITSLTLWIVGANKGPSKSVIATDDIKQVEKDKAKKAEVPVKTGKKAETAPVTTTTTTPASTGETTTPAAATTDTKPAPTTTAPATTNTTDANKSETPQTPTGNK